jgi:probable rRNA maturation factor
MPGAAPTETRAASTRGAKTPSAASAQSEKPVVKARAPKAAKAKSGELNDVRREKQHAEKVIADNDAPKAASTRAAKSRSASVKAAKLKARADVSWTQSADTLARSTPPGRAALAKVAKRACEYSLRRASFKNDDLLARLEGNASVAVDITFVDDGEIAELNADYRGKPRPTDVLSFAQGEGEENDGFFAFPDAPLMLGDIIVSLQTALRQASEQRHDIAAEISFLVAHGTLHLIGYDHGKAAERRVMFALQDEIVEELRGAVAPAS